MTVELHNANCATVLIMQPPGSIDSIVTDPPYGLVSTVKRFGKKGSAPAKSDGATGVYQRASAGFMGQQWDGTGIEKDPEFWRLCFEVLKPGGYFLAFGGTRTWHRIAGAIEDAGFEVRDTLMWLYGTGFPKSHDVSKGIDRTLGVEREIVGTRQAPGFAKANVQHGAQNRSTTEFAEFSGEAATPEGEKWQGWGTALKPAWEPIIVARKPLIGTVAANVLAHGVGAMNIRACRIGDEVRVYKGSGAQRNKLDNHGPGDTGLGLMDGRGANLEFEAIGRWPANVIGDDSLPQDFWRFFYGTKASKKDRNTDWQDREIETKNAHPTVKPTDLMEWLVRLVTPPGGTVLDPFMGSGSTGKAARRQGLNFMGIEADKTFFQIAAERCGANDGSDFETALADLQAAVQRNKEARRGWMEE